MGKRLQRKGKHGEWWGRELNVFIVKTVLRLGFFYPCEIRRQKSKVMKSNFKTKLIIFFPKCVPTSLFSVLVRNTLNHCCLKTPDLFWTSLSHPCSLPTANQPPSESPGCFSFPHSSLTLLPHPNLGPYHYWPGPLQIFRLISYEFPSLLIGCYFSYFLGPRVLYLLQLCCTAIDNHHSGKIKAESRKWIKSRTKLKKSAERRELRTA